MLAATRRCHAVIEAEATPESIEQYHAPGTTRRHPAISHPAIPHVACVCMYVADLLTALHTHTIHTHIQYTHTYNTHTHTHAHRCTLRGFRARSSGVPHRQITRAAATQTAASSDLQGGGGNLTYYPLNIYISIMCTHHNTDIRTYHIIVAGGAGKDEPILQTTCLDGCVDIPT